MRTSDVIKSKYIRGKDLEGHAPMTLTIADVTEELVGRGGHQESKCILWFNEDHRGISLNKSRVLILEAAYGPETDQWSGKRVRLYFDPAVEFGGRRVGGVGIRTPPGVVYQANGAQPGWGDVPQTPAGASPPPPVWDGTKWVVQQPTAAAAAPARPPPPVWNATSQQWETVDTATGEMSPPKHVPPPTISQRVNAGHPPATADGWAPVAPPPAQPEFDDDIPF